MGVWTSLRLLLQLLLMIIFLWMFGLPAINRYLEKQVTLMLWTRMMLMLDADADADSADGADADDAGDGGDIEEGHWWDPSTLNHHHGNLGPAHFSLQKLQI